MPAPITITGFETHDLRFPTSQHLDGSDAMNPDPDYSAAYVVLRTNATGLCGHGMTFTIGRGNELCVAAIHSLASLLVGQPLESLMRRPVDLYRRLTADSQLRWVGPEKGVIHLAAAAVINAVWDLWARVHGKPLWRLVGEMSPEEFVASVDFRYLADALTPGAALELLRAREPGKPERIAHLVDSGYPSYTTTTSRLVGSATIHHRPGRPDEIAGRAVAPGHRLGKRSGVAGRHVRLERRSRHHLSLGAAARAQRSARLLRLLAECLVHAVQCTAAATRRPSPRWFPTCTATTTSASAPSCRPTTGLPRWSPRSSRMASSRSR